MFLKLDEGTEHRGDAARRRVIVRSAVDDEDTRCSPKGLGYTVLVSTAARSRSSSAVSRELAKAVADGLRERAHTAATAHERAGLRAVPVSRRHWGRHGRVGLNRWCMADTTAPSPSPTFGGSISDLDITTEQLSATRPRSMSPVTDAVRDASGAAGLGYLVALVDVNTAMVGLCAAHPDWTATADLMLHEAAPLVHGPDDPGEPSHPRRVAPDRGRASTSTTATASPTWTSSATRSTSAASPPGLVTFARVPASTSSVSATWDPTRRIGHAAPHRTVRRPCRPSRCSSAAG